MLYPEDRNGMRRYFCEVWRKYSAREALVPLELLVAQTIAQHPEYHSLFVDANAILEKDYTREQGERNPFLHLGLHIAVHEQMTTDRPDGLRSIYRRLLRRYGDSHAVEHLIAKCLSAHLWQSQRNNHPAHEAAYLECLRRIR